MSSAVHTYAVCAELILGAVTFVALLTIAAPYGRYLRNGFGPDIPSRLGWIVMESPAVFVFGAIYLAGSHRFEPVPLIFLSMWWFHYINRTLVFPFRLTAAAKRMPVLIVALAIAFNLLNAFVNARWISEVGRYNTAWILDPRFAFGAVLFFSGFAIHHRADLRLFALRAPGESGYKIPRGGLHELVSSPNYFGEILEWTGWAIATWSLAGAAFAVYSVANLLPRALQHHRWYKAQFSDYPKNRKALIPYLL